jgi:PAS domain S-box-containing protein
MDRSTLDDINDEHKRIDNTLRFIAQRGWMSKAENFLPALAQHLGESLGMKYAIVYRLIDDPNIAEIVALYAQNNLVPETSYLLKNTPCEQVLDKKLCCFPKSVQAQFPADPLLAHMGVESYAGIPLSDSTGQAIGLIAVMDNKPISDEKSVGRLLQLLETAAAAALERARSDRALHASERKFRSLAENSPDHIARYTPDGRILYINPVVEKTLGIRLKDLAGKVSPEQRVDNIFKETTARVSEVARSGVGSDWDVHFQVADGSWRWHAIHFVPERDETGTVVSVLGIGHDITERKKMEAKLSASRNFLNRIIDSIADPIFVKDRQHQWIYVNQAFCRLVGHRWRHDY